MPSVASSASPTRRTRARRQLATYFVGQVVGQMNDAKSARRVVQEMVEEYVAVMERLDSLTAD